MADRIPDAPAKSTPQEQSPTAAFTGQDDRGDDLVISDIEIESPSRPMHRALRIAAKTTLVLLLVLAVAVAAIAGRVIWYYGYEIGLPDHHHVASASATVCSSEGNRTYVPLADIPPMVRKAVLAAEDASFYARPPTNPLLDIANQILFDRKQGVSFFSMAASRCLISRTQCCRRMIDWHIGNAIVVYRLERDISEDAIFEVFLNESWMGRDSRGVIAAADAYFGKSLGDLSLDEIAFIAALPKAPSSIGENSRERNRATKLRPRPNGGRSRDQFGRGRSSKTSSTAATRTSRPHLNVA